MALQDQQMTSDTDQPSFRRDAILDAALIAFSSYGHRRTTMQDIAQGVGISRPALYLHFPNKDDILRSLAARFFDDSEIAVAAALALPDRSYVETLSAAFHAYDGKFMAMVFGTQHGPEMLDAGHKVSADLVAEGEARIHRLLANWLHSQPIPAALGGAEALAAMALAALKGLKQAAKSAESYRHAQHQLAQVLGLALVSRQ